ncbi:hypothetical protein [Spongiivirga citrea]|uniref:Uncharacterized protein n=1 Tax=Spongiivirga citrea TaxID=1481457 RepID=A0A6M0CD76_9FLAO|nr:hypothetical protein [Spongiivirga citrea]NER15756.1 hypothetical protein [Spongiivirga citrea]
MARAMFEYSKNVLQRVSFDITLFARELKKAMKRLLPHEVDELKIWVRQLVLIQPELEPCLVYLKN